MESDRAENAPFPAPKHRPLGDAGRVPSSWAGAGWAGLVTVLVLLAGGTLTWWLTAQWQREAEQDDQLRFNRGAGVFEPRLRDRLKIYGGGLERLALVASWSGGDTNALGREFQRLLTEESLASLTEWGWLECEPDSRDSRRRPRATRSLVTARRSGPGPAWEMSTSEALGSLADADHARAIRHLRPENELALALWEEAPGGPSFRLFAAVQPAGNGPEKSGPRVIFGTIPVADLMEEVFRLGEANRGVQLALYRSNTNRPAAVPAGLASFFGAAAPLNPPPQFRAVSSKPLLGLSVLWETYSSRQFERRGMSHRVALLRQGGGVATVLVAMLLGGLVYSRAWHMRNERRLAHLNAALERERATRLWLTRNLHDGLLQDLHGAALFLGRESAATAENGGAGRNALRLLASVQEDIRNFIQLNEGRLPAGHTLPGLMQELAQRVRQRSEVEVTVELEGTHWEDVPPMVQFELWLAAREAVANAVKHAEASRLQIVLQRTAEAVQLRVADDGTGFDPTQPAADGHWGLSNLRTRALSVGGTLMINSRPNQGTTVELTCPLNVSAPGTDSPAKTQVNPEGPT